MLVKEEAGYAKAERKINQSFCSEKVTWEVRTALKIFF